jgi:hypothetical protein
VRALFTLFSKKAIYPHTPHCQSIMTSDSSKIENQLDRTSFSTGGGGSSINMRIVPQPGDDVFIVVGCRVIMKGVVITGFAEGVSHQIDQKNLRAYHPIG